MLVPKFADADNGDCDGIASGIAVAAEKAMAVVAVAADGDADSSFGSDRSNRS